MIPFRQTGAKLVLLSVLALLMLCSEANAAMTLQFNFTFDSNNPGTISYDGTPAGVLHGEGIEFSSVTGIGTPLNDGVTVGITGGVLTFNTGAITGPPVLSTFGGFTSGTWEFSGGGDFILVGSVDGNPAVNLVSGHFVGDSGFAGLTSSSAGGGAFSGVGIDEKHSSLLAIFGISDPDFIFANTDVVATSFSPIGNTGSFTAIVSDAVLTNSALPEPTALALWSVLSAGGLGLVRLRRRMAA